MNWIMDRMELRDNQAKAGRICLSKFALSTIREGHQYFPEVFGGSCKAEKYCSEITYLLMRPAS